MGARGRTVRRPGGGPPVPPQEGRSTYVHIEPYPTPNILVQDWQASRSSRFRGKFLFRRLELQRPDRRWPGREEFYRSSGGGGAVLQGEKHRVPAWIMRMGAAA